ncbi:sperm flagellar protein 1-like isoform X1 [Xiphophorus maculatus]|uniref:sperm flagellar protein 1-like isoform X2 n=2 Tax=Xiphophorus maculatus TaxID=8083 RepID=UPI000C6D7259|nr:sperm flagellar protein 1-like isoform X2 [Xiphophorus maculatus]XP_023183139.1 sperm flagellar protein 1-like isoform X1 [Xiphophorus maculatus]XP_023183141.1 sperm flagellar protein 1-like isoform X1 [Xiphophorus maculatus]
MKQTHYQTELIVLRSEMCMVLGMDRLLSEKEERDTLTWIDKIPFSRPKKNVSRDFSDGVMVAEIVKHYFPRIVDIHNYITSCKTQQKRNNWKLLNKKVFSKLDFYVSEDMVEKIVSSTPGVILQVLFSLKEKLEKKLTFSDVEIQQAEAEIVAQLEKMKITEPTVEPHQVIYFTEMSLSATRQVILEKELQIEELQDILRNLWVKMSKLEELIQLKDKRIEHLTSLSEMY